MLHRLRGRAFLLASLLGGAATWAAAQAPMRLPPAHEPSTQEAPLPRERAAPPERIEPRAYTLADLEAMALAANPSLAQMSARVDAARGACQQAGLPPNPRIGYQGGEIGHEGRAGMQGGYVAQEFVRGGKLQLSQAVACQGVLRAQQDYQAQRLRVLTDVRSEFYRALAAQRRLELAQEIAGLSDKSVETVKSLIEAGTATGVDLLQGRIEVETARIALENAENRHRASWRRLASFLGTPDMAPARLEGELARDVPTYDFDEVVGRLLLESPELAVAEIDAERASLALARARREPIPNVDIMLGAQKDFASGDTVANVQIEFPIPLWNRNQGGIYQARAEMIAAQAEISRVELALRNRLAGTFERYANSRYQAARYSERILPDAREALALTSRAYQNGQVGFLNVLSTQRTYVQASLAQLDALIELRESAVLLDGLLLGDSLQAGGMNEAPAAQMPSSSGMGGAMNAGR